MQIVGTGHALFAFDVGQSIDLARAERALAQLRRRERIGRKRRAPAWAENVEAPLLLTQSAPIIDLGPCKTDPQVELVLYDFGAVAVTYAIPLDARLEDLAETSALLDNNPSLEGDARLRVEQLIKNLGGAVEKPNVAPVPEDYAVFEIRLPPGVAPNSLWQEHATAVARILRGERGALSEQEVADALLHRVSYGPQDVALVDWCATVLVGDDVSEERWVLEYANVELLEMRNLDRQLDLNLNRAYEILTRRPRFWGRAGGAFAGDLRGIAQLQADNAMLYEGANNAFKLLGDQYLARLYRVVSERFHLTEWDTTIERKLHTLESIHSKLADRAASARMEMLEWIIILLIAVSIAAMFVPGTTSH